MAETVIAPAVLATAWRGTAPEAVIRGHIAVVDKDGGLLESRGNPEALTTVRSSGKPIQAMPLADAAATLGIDDEELAVACGSHCAQAEHVAVVSRLLAKVGVDASALRCGPQIPGDRVRAAERTLSGEPAGALDNNCSGKHAGMLAACVANGWPIETYLEPSHPLQQLIDAHLSRLSGVDLATEPVGTDGCGLPTHAVPVSGLAAAFARGNADPLFRHCQAAMAAYPVMVSGTGRFDTVVLETLGDEFTCKGGALAVWVAVRRTDGQAIAIKLESGWSEYMPAIACAAMQRFELLDEIPEELARFADTTVFNRAGLAVGEVRIEF